MGAFPPPMSPFLKNFLHERRGGLFSRARGPGVFLGAFGKHPGWEDHMDDLGLETDSLVLAKRALYTEGIGGLLDSGAWERLPEADRLPYFWHAFLWWRGETRGLLGRMWSSTDGKGRERYPMMVVLQAENVSDGWLLGAALDGLEALESACRATENAREVREALDAARGECRRGATRAAEQETSPWLPPWPAAWADGADDTPGGEREASLRTLYRAGNELVGFAVGGDGPGSGEAASRARTLRLPAWAGERPAVCLGRWRRVFGELLDPEVPALLLLPLEGDWADLIVGEPAGDSLFGLRAGPAALPPAGVVPYTFGANWRACAGRVLATAGRSDRRGGETAATRFWRATVETCAQAGCPKEIRWADSS